MEIKSLCEAYKNHFKIGAAVSNESLAVSSELLKKHYNSITCEDQMKCIAIHPGENVWNFAPADEIADFARANGITMRGHAFVWHHRVPEWMSGLKADGSFDSRELVLGRMESHMRTMLDRYRDIVRCWDVVNEACNDTDAPLATDEPYPIGDILRESSWRHMVGLDYVEEAFRMAARLSPPSVKLVYNDYSVFKPSKLDRIYRLLRGLLDKGIRVDAVGIQGHWCLGYPDETVLRNGLERLTSLGIEIQITELDVSLYERKDCSVYSGERLASALDRQTERFARLFSVLRDFSKHIESVTFWAIADDITWLSNSPVPGRKCYPSLFDENHHPKPAFFRVTDF